jgi:hypothetical protein
MLETNFGSMDAIEVSEAQIIGNFGRVNGRLHIAGLSDRKRASKPELALASNPEPSSGSPESNSRNRKNDGKNGGDGSAMVVKGFSDLDDKEWKHAISGAVFLFGLFGYFAYLIVTRDQGKKPNEKHKPDAQPK